MRVWIDLTNSPHVLVLRPIIALLQQQGHQVEVTSRDFAQTQGLLSRFAIKHTAIGHHRGQRRLSKAVGLLDRSRALTKWAHDRQFDLAIGHGSNDISVAAKRLRVPSVTMFDYEWAWIQHNVNCRLARRVIVPDAIDPDRLARYGATGKLARYSGLKEEYYLSDFEPDPSVLEELGLEPDRVIVVVRTPPDAALYHRVENDVFSGVIDRLAQMPTTQVVVMPRTSTQEDALRSRAIGNFTIPKNAIDAQSLIAYADLVVGAGGTMNREAVALGTPVYTTFAGRLGAVDEQLLGDGRLRLLEHPEALKPQKRTDRAAERIRRDPQVLVDMMLGVV